MKKSVIVRIILLGFFLFSLFLHFNHLGTAPKSLLVDEAADAYDSYAILQTGADQYGTPHPLIFKSFGDQKLPLYIYSSVLPIKLFGLNNFSIRFVAAAAMSLLVIVMFLFLQELEFDEWTSLVGAGITAVAPWTFILGRLGWETGPALLIFTTALLFLIKAFKKNTLLFPILGMISLGVAWYAYIPYRLIALFVLCIFLILYKTSLKKKILCILIFFVCILPSLQGFLSPAGSARFKQTSIVYDSVHTLIVNDERVFCNEFGKQLLCSALVNKPIEIAYTALVTFTRVVSVQYLFIAAQSDGTLMNIGKFALLPIFMAPFYLLGFMEIAIKNKELRKKKYLLLLGFTFAACFIPILVTRDPVREQMSSLFLFILVIIMFGYAFAASLIKSKIFHAVILVGLFLYGGLLGFYFTNITTRKYYGNETFMRNAAYYIGTQSKKMHTVYIDSSFADFIIYYAFYNKISPTFYQKNIVLSSPDSGGFQHSVGLENITITHANYRELACSAKENGEKDLFVTNHDLSQEIAKPLLRPLFTGQELHQLVYGYVYNLADLCATN